MKNYDRDKESSNLMYLDANNLCGWALEKNTSKFGEKFLKIYDEYSDIGYILDVEYPKRLQNFHNDLPCLPERMKIKKCGKLVCNPYDNKYVTHIRTL